MGPASCLPAMRRILAVLSSAHINRPSGRKASATGLSRLTTSRLSVNPVGIWLAGALRAPASPSSRTTKTLKARVIERSPAARAIETSRARLDSAEDGRPGRIGLTAVTPVKGKNKRSRGVETGYRPADGGLSGVSRGYRIAAEGQKRSVRARVAEHAGEGQQDDLDVEPERPVPDVVEVVLDATVERRVAAQSVHLRPAGDPGLDVVAQHVAGHRGAKLVHVDWALRPRTHQAHLAEEHVPELRQLVERERAQDRPRARAPRVPGPGPALPLGLGVRAHGAELEHPEAPAVEADALLRVEHRARRVEPHPERD